MKITVIGRGNVGGGLARRWRDAGHEVQELGRDGGDGSDADVLLVAVPGSGSSGPIDRPNVHIEKSVRKAGSLMTIWE